MHDFENVYGKNVCVCRGKGGGAMKRGGDEKPDKVASDQGLHCLH